MDSDRKDLPEKGAFSATMYSSLEVHPDRGLRRDHTVLLQYTPNGGYQAPILETDLEQLEVPVVPPKSRFILSSTRVSGVPRLRRNQQGKPWKHHEGGGFSVAAAV